MPTFSTNVKPFSLTLVSCIFLLLHLCAASTVSYAQTENVKTDSVKIGFLPALGYSSDIGFVAGGLASRYHYREGVEPFQSHLQSAALATTKGLFSFMLMFDQVETFNRPIRSKSLINIGRIKEATYFGLGNDSPFDKELWDSDNYFYETYFGLLEVSGRKVILKHPEFEKSHLDLMLITGIQLHRPQLGIESSFLETTPPDYVDGGWSWEVGLGLVWENRDNEFAATRGNAGLINFRYAPGIIADFTMWQLHMQASQYATAKIIFPVTAAIKIGYHQSGGSTPFWMLPVAGGEYSMRGYAEGRFRGDASLYYTAELRTWLIRYPSAGFRLGGQLFRDGGRVYESGEIATSFFKHHHQTYGLGAALSLFTYDFIVRADLAFSEDIHRIYLGIGYTF
jgi:hypothetical protein